MTYSTFCGIRQNGETPILRFSRCINSLKKQNKYGIRTYYEVFEHAINNGYKNNNCLGTRFINGILQDDYEWMTYEDIFKYITKYAQGINTLNLCPSKDDEYGLNRKICIFSENNKDWLLTYWACCINSIVTITMFDSLGEDNIEYILNQTEVETIVLSPRTLKTFISLTSSSKVKYIKNIILTNAFSLYDVSCISRLKNYYTVYSCIDIVNNSVNCELQIPTPNTHCLICYTSGSTGQPKGAMITQNQILCNSDISEKSGGIVTDKDIYLSYLPLAHIMELFITSAFIVNKGAIGLFSNSYARIVQDAQILNPTIICSVPRIIQSIKDTVLKKIKSLPNTLRYFVDLAYNKQIDAFKRSNKIGKNIFNRLCLSKIRHIFGNKLRFILTGGTFTAQSTIDFILAILEVKFISAYGQTENCAALCLSHLDDDNQDHVGGPGFITEIKLIDVPELGYLTTDVLNGISRPRGEILCRGEQVFTGYYKNEEATKEVLDKDGWFHTGDVGEILTDHGNALRIIDRVKNLFKLQNGEYIAPEKIENIIIGNSKLIRQIFITASDFSKYLVAIVVPHDIKTPKNELLSEISNISKFKNLYYYEFVKDIFIVEGPFTIENGYLTATLKLKRKLIKEKYQDKIEEMCKQ